MREYEIVTSGPSSLTGPDAFAGLHLQEGEYFEPIDQDIEAGTETYRLIIGRDVSEWLDLNDKVVIYTENQDEKTIK